MESTDSREACDPSVKLTLLSTRASLAMSCSDQRKMTASKARPTASAIRAEGLQDGWDGKPLRMGDETHSRIRVTLDPSGL